MTSETMTSAAHTDDAAHVLPVVLYLKIYAALLVLTVVTVGVSMLDLGDPADRGALQALMRELPGMCFFSAVGG